MAALQGIDLEEEVASGPSERPVDDIKDLSGWRATQEGFGIGMGLGFVEIED